MLVSSCQLMLTTEHLDRRMKHLTNGLLNHFWRRWRNEYLLELRDDGKGGDLRRRLMIVSNDCNHNEQPH